MAGEWKSWLKPNPNTFASFHPVGQKGRKGDRHSRPALLRSRIIPFRVFCALKYKYDGGKEIFFLFFPSLPFLIHLQIFFFLWNWKVSDSDRKYENERFNFWGYAPPRRGGHIEYYPSIISFFRTSVASWTFTQPTSFYTVKVLALHGLHLHTVYVYAYAQRQRDQIFDFVPFHRKRNYFPKQFNTLTEYKLIEFETKTFKKKETKMVASLPINTMGHGMDP